LNSHPSFRGPFRKSVAPLSPIAFGAFKIGRNVGIKYPQRYELPDDEAVSQLLNGVLDLGINVIDTAPAYGSSEERIGRHLTARRHEFFLCSKVGETFENGVSNYDFAADAIVSSVERSLLRLQTDRLDLLSLHVPADDLAVLHETPAVTTLQRLRDRGLVRWLGFSAKTVAAAELACSWADVLMLEYYTENQEFEPVMERAAEQGIGIFIKKALASGKLPADDAVKFVLRNPAVTTAVIGSLSLEHLQQNLAAARAVRE